MLRSPVASVPPTLVSPSARALVERAVTPSDRVVVIGGTGWFGRTALNLLGGTRAQILAVASTPRSFTVAGRAHAAVAWSEADVRRFAPTVLIDCAFLTRDRVATMSFDDYAAANRALTERMLTVASLPSTRLALTISSGAAVYPVDALSAPESENPYGFLKREAELALEDLATRSGVSGVVARAWSVSGAYVRHPRNYALADFILQARTSVIRVRASRPVWRRYAGADELLAVAIAGAHPGFSVVDSGGPLVEMGTLAESVRDALNQDAVIQRAERDSERPDSYHNDGAAWLTALDEVGLTPMSLREQILLSAAGLASPAGD